MSVGAINSLLSGYPVSPVSRWSAQPDFQVEHVQPPREIPFSRESISRAEARHYPRAEISRLSQDEQEELNDYIRLQLVRLMSFLKV